MITDAMAATSTAPADTSLMNSIFLLYSVVTVSHTRSSTVFNISVMKTSDIVSISTLSCSDVSI